MAEVWKMNFIEQECMPDSTQPAEWDTQPVLLLQGGSAAARQMLMRHLRATSIEYRLIEVPMADGDRTSPVERFSFADFFQDFNERLNRLTKKEVVVLNCILQGHTNKAISLKLGLCQRAVELRKASLMKKLKSKSHTELVSLITRYHTLKQYLAFEAEQEVSPDIGTAESSQVVSGDLNHGRRRLTAK